jgi:hypothetical protein
MGNIWGKEEVPDEWRESYIVKIPQKRRQQPVPELEKNTATLSAKQNIQ